MKNKNLMKKVQELVNFRLEKGVSPYDLVKNIEEDEYKEYIIKKIKSGYICSIKFVDNDEITNCIENITYQYIYNNEMVLLKINSIIDNKLTLIWSRKSEEYSKLKCLLKEFKKQDNESKNKFIDTLPLDLRLLIDEEINNLDDKKIG